MLQVLQHVPSPGGYDAASVRRLVRTNWVLTVEWSIRGIVAALLLVQVMSS